jgi:hypothetical protein
MFDVHMVEDANHIIKNLGREKWKVAKKHIGW